MTTKKANWYHDSDFTHTHDIFCVEGDEDLEAILNACEGDAYGPFESYAKAKADALVYHRSDVTTARHAMAEIRARKAPKTVRK